MNTNDNKINYLEFKAKNIGAIKDFYSNCFGWEFTDYGSTYSAFSNSGLEGGFEQSENDIINGVLVVLYHEDLELILEKIIANNGIISKEIFSFPGGRRFHFNDPSGNKLAVWSDN